MKNLAIPGSVWVIGLALVNALPVALNDAFPGAIWVPLVIDLLAVAAKAIQVYGPKKAAPVPANGRAPQPANFVAPVAPASAASSLRSFLLG